MFVCHNMRHMRQSFPTSIGQLRSLGTEAPNFGPRASSLSHLRVRWNGRTSVWALLSLEATPGLAKRREICNWGFQTSRRIRHHRRLRRRKTVPRLASRTVIDSFRLEIGATGTWTGLIFLSRTRMERLRRFIGATARCTQVPELIGRHGPAQSVMHLASLLVTASLRSEIGASLILMVRMLPLHTKMDIQPRFSGATAHYIQDREPTGM